MTAATTPRSASLWKLLDAPPWPLFQILLALATFGTTVLFGAWVAAGTAAIDDALRFPAVVIAGEGYTAIAAIQRWLVAGLPYAIAVMTFFLAHEMGHWLACRYHRVACTWPTFVPLPPPFHLGTLGAVILVRQPIRSRRALFDIGIAGPLAGVIVTLALLGTGYALQPPDPLPLTGPIEGETWGPSLLTYLLSHLSGLATSARLPGDALVRAGWVGMLATAMNLMPAGQLDGGHIVYAFSATVHRWVGRFIPLFLWGLVLASWVYWQVPSVWLIWAVLTTISGRRHPPLTDREEPLGPIRIGLALVALLLLVLCFCPHPIAFDPRIE